MPDENSDLVQKQLLELAQQVVPIIQACNKEKRIIENEFESVSSNIQLFETRVQTNHQDMDSEVLGVGSQMQQLQAALQEIYTSIARLQDQDNKIVEEANTIFEGLQEKMRCLGYRISD